MVLLPPTGSIHLVLVPGDDPFYLEVPIAAVDTVCLRPRRYLQYLGWCILGTDGVLTDRERVQIPLDGRLDDQAIYHYVVPGNLNNILAHAVDPEVIGQRSRISSGTTGIRGDFRARLLERDGFCVWTGTDETVTEGMHIIPHARGSEWLQLIIENRPHEDESLNTLDIDDIRDGICASVEIHRFFESRVLVILRTPNPILQTTDVPDRYERNIEPGVSYPVDTRYTLQWLGTPKTRSTRDRNPNNSDATFRDQQLPKPADVLLHYNYGAAAVRKWGRNTHFLHDRPGIPRPPPPVPAPMGPPKTKHNHGASVRKRFRHATSTIIGKFRGKDDGRGGGPSGTTADTSEMPDTMDEDDIMLFFWSNSKVARDRHARKEQEHIAYVEGWRAAVAANSAIS